MRQAIIVGITALLLSVVVPMVLMVPLQPAEPEEIVLVVQTPQKSTAVKEMITVQNGAGTQTMDLETYLVGVVLSEMPGEFEFEALKAQAVAARTFALRKKMEEKHPGATLCSNSTCCQAWTSQETLREKLGANADHYWEKAELAVRETSGEVLTYGGELIEAVYFSCSGGATEDAVAVWGNEVPYLQSVPSYGEERAGKYYSEITIPAETVSEILKKETTWLHLPSDPSTWIKEIKYTSGGGVDTMQIGNIWFSGTQLRTLFGLNSTRFSVRLHGDTFVFSVFGYGHRVGMSQYGANAMALAGNTYKDILTYYYADVSIEKKNP